MKTAQPIFRTVSLIGAVLLLGGCGSSCDEESLKAKQEEIKSKMMQVVASGDMNKIMGLTRKMQKIAASASASDKDNLQAACKMADEILDELD